MRFPTSRGIRWTCFGEFDFVVLNEVYGFIGTGSFALIPIKNKPCS